jgi:thiamine kinase-like enzyme
MDGKIKKALELALGAEARSAQVEPLAGGITNRNFLVRVGDRRLVLRLAGEKTADLGIDREEECETAALAAKSGLSPAVVFASPGQGILLCEFIEGAALSPEAVLEPERFGRIVEAIGHIHRSPPFPGRFSGFATIRQYHADSLKLGVHLPETTRKAKEILGIVEGALGAPSLLFPCHNDLLAANFIDDGHRIWVLDWEYAGMGDRFFDLGNFAANLELPEDRCSALVESYFGRRSEPLLARLSLMRLVSDLREAYWGFLQSALSHFDFNFNAYGVKHLGRALAVAATPGFNDWVKAARAKKV